MKKKLMSFAVAVVMLLGGAALLPAGALSDDAYNAVSAQASVLTGKCGENVTWTLRDGVMTLSGTGDMYDYDDEHLDQMGKGVTPYSIYMITDLIVEEGVTSIGKSAFNTQNAGGQALKSVTLPEGLTKIGEDAFGAQSKITELKLPSTIKSVGGGAFWLARITELTIPAGFTNINEGAFVTMSLNKLTIEEGVETIGSDAFNNNDDLKSVAIPKSVKFIGDFALGYYSGVSEDHTQSVETKVDGFTIYCYKGTAGEKYAKDNGFAYKYLEPYDYKQLDDGTIEITKCNLEESTIVIPSEIDGKPVTSIGEKAFFFLTNLTEVTIPGSVKTIGDMAFGACLNLKKATIQDGVTTIGENMFNGCEKLESITIPNTVTTIGTSAFTGCIGFKNFDIPNGVTSIGNWAFSRCSNLESVTIPQSVKSIGRFAFSLCKLTSVTIPKTVETIDFAAFGYTLVDNTYTKLDDFTIYGYTGSEAEKYANDVNNKFKFVSLGTAEPTVTRLKGSGRFATAAAISTAAYPKTADTVVLANGRKFYDALAGVTLANAYDAPILLTEANALPAETLAEIKRLKATKVMILGGSGSVGAEVKTELEKNGLKFEIVKGSSRFATAVEIANKTKEKTQKDPTEIFFVSSDKFADALSVSAVAALKKAPIIYLPKTGAIDADTAEYLKTMKGKIKNAYVIGGSGVISNEVVKAAGKALGLTVDKTIVRVKGSTKYDTCVAVNTKFASVLKGTAICVATGEDFPDALAGGVFAAIKGAPLFLAAGSLSDNQKSYLQSKNADSIYVFGGSKSVPDTLVQSIAAASV